MNKWGKVCIANVGDKVCAQCAISQAQEQTLRNVSFIQVCSLLVVGVVFSLNHLQYTLMVANHQCSCHPAPDIWQIFYERLESIWDLVLPASCTLHLTQPTQFLLALVIPCSTRGKDVTKEVTTYHSMMTSIFKWWNVSWGAWSMAMIGESLITAGTLLTVFVDPEDNGD